MIDRSACRTSHRRRSGWRVLLDLQARQASWSSIDPFISGGSTSILRLSITTWVVFAVRMQTWCQNWTQHFSRELKYWRSSRVVPAFSQCRWELIRWDENVRTRWICIITWNDVVLSSLTALIHSLPLVGGYLFALNFDLKFSIIPGNSTLAFLLFHVFFFFFFG